MTIYKDNFWQFRSQDLKHTEAEMTYNIKTGKEKT